MPDDRHGQQYKDMYDDLGKTKVTLACSPYYDEDGVAQEDPSSWLGVIKAMFPQLKDWYPRKIAKFLRKHGGVLHACPSRELLRVLSRLRGHQGPRTVDALEAYFLTVRGCMPKQYCKPLAQLVITGSCVIEMDTYKLKPTAASTQCTTLPGPTSTELAQIKQEQVLDAQQRSMQENHAQDQKRQRLANSAGAGSSRDAPNNEDSDTSSETGSATTDNMTVGELIREKAYQEEELKKEKLRLEKVRLWNVINRIKSEKAKCTRMAEQELAMM